MRATANEDEFYRRAAFYRYHPGFQLGERDYKIRLASMFVESREAMQVDLSRGLSLLEKALRSRDDNIINWRLQVKLFRWFKSNAAEAGNTILGLWNESSDLAERFEAFTQRIRKADCAQPGAQLVIGSTLMMAVSTSRFPPVRMEAFKFAMELAGRNSLYSAKGATERYLLALSFMDSIIEEATKYEIELRDRLDAQGVIWCIADGWPGAPIPPDWVDNPAARKRDFERELTQEEIEEVYDKEIASPTVTEKQALVLARRGQGKFRENVLSIWGNCAVTECCELAMLRASHIKPWKDSSNHERLDGHNGLLLAPNVDAAFDKGFVSFKDDGGIIISPLLKTQDGKALGIHNDLRLRRVKRDHLPYLAYHRKYVFKKKNSS